MLSSHNLWFICTGFAPNVCLFPLVFLCVWVGFVWFCFFFSRPTPLWLSPGRSTSLYLPEINFEKHAMLSIGKAAKESECGPLHSPYSCSSDISYPNRLTISATPAMRNGGRCEFVPRLPRETTVDVRLCHACHAKWCGVTGAKFRPKGATQYHKCHACHAKRR